MCVYGKFISMFKMFIHPLEIELFSFLCLLDNFKIWRYLILALHPSIMRISYARFFRGSVQPSFNKFLDKLKFNNFKIIC